MAVRPAALVSDEKRIRGVYARCAIQMDTFTFLPLTVTTLNALNVLEKPEVEMFYMTSESR